MKEHKIKDTKKKGGRKNIKKKGRKKERKHLYRTQSNNTEK